MSTLSVSTIQSSNSTSDLTIRASNTTGSQIVLFANGAINLPTLATVNTDTIAVNTLRVGNGSSGATGQVLQSNGTVLTWSNIGVVTANNTDSQTFYLPMSNVISGAWTNSVISNSKLYFVPSTGTLNATVFNALSDISKKKDVSQIVNAMDTISMLRGVEFVWIDNELQSAGIIAQEAEGVVPHLVSENNDGIKSVNYLGLIGYLIEANKELKTRLEALENKYYKTDLEPNG